MARPTQWCNAPRPAGDALSLLLIGDLGRLQWLNLVLSGLMTIVAAIGLLRAPPNWDVIHYVRDKVVSRSLTEFCFVLDFALGAVLLLTAWNVLPR